MRDAKCYGALVATGPTRRRKRQRGGIDELPSGALRVRVYAGMDPISKRRLYLSEIVPAGPPRRQRCADRMASINFSAGASLTMYPAAPASIPAGGSPAGRR